MVICQSCGVVDLPAAVFEHYERQERKRSETAVRSAPDEDASMRERARFFARKDLARTGLQESLATVANEESYDRESWQAQARELNALLRGYLAEIANAKDARALARAESHVAEILGGDLGRALRSEYGQSQERAWREYEAQQRAAQQEQDMLIVAKREREALEESRPRAIGSGSGPAPAGSPYAEVAAMIAESKVRREREIAVRGECEFGHWSRSAAERIYGVPVRDWSGNPTGMRLANTPAYRACARHRRAAEARLGREGYPDVAWWEA